MSGGRPGPLPKGAYRTQSGKYAARYYERGLSIYIGSFAPIDEAARGSRRGAAWRTEDARGHRLGAPEPPRLQAEEQTMINTSGSYHAAVGVKNRRSKKPFLSAPRKAKAKIPVVARPQQEVPNLGVSSFGRRRKSKMRGI